MKPLNRALQIACVLLFNGIGCWQDLPDGQIANRLEAYLKPFVETGNLTGTVFVARKGRVLFRHRYGMANYELQVPNSPETRFHLASHTAVGCQVR
jgi:CubicO group peptidase (beta-lactamase class C family)